MLVGEKATVDSLKACVFGFGLLVDGDVGVGVFPEGEKVFVCRQSSNPRRVRIGVGGVLRLQGVRSGYTKPR